VILLIGKSESGKSSLVFSLLNFLYNVHKEHDFRFVIHDEHTKTKDQIVEYKFNNSSLPYSVTVVDTPGLEIDSTLPLIRDWVSAKVEKSHRVRLDALGIVTRHNEPPPNAALIAKFRQLERTFGGDLRSNVWPFITFGEKLQKSTAEESLRKAGLRFDDVFVVNNLGFVPETDQVSALKHLIHYKANVVSLSAFFEVLDTKTHPLLLVRGGTHSR